MTSAGRKLVDSIRDAIQGNFASVTIDGQTWIKKPGHKPIPSNWWAIGYRTERGFQVRRLVSGRLLARHEKREGETVKRATVFVEAEQK